MNRGRLPIVVVLVVSLLCAGIARQWAAAERSSGPGAAPRATSGAAALSQMNSYALALLLGGLRGPLVMFLWPSAELQKQSKNLEDFDTKIEWIRLLQAEFDTVHLFQIWNKAYNISAQLASLSNKYRTILDALDYAHSVDQERPNDLNIISAIAGLYFDKFGCSAEKTYYRERVRDETQARADMIRITFPTSRGEDLEKIASDAAVPSAKLLFSEDIGDVMSVTLPKPMADLIQAKFTGPGITYADRPRIRANRDDPGWRRMELDPILDAQGNLLPQYLVPTMPRPADLDPSSEWNDGSELQYLKQYQPFPYGVSTLALGYNYYKRAQVLLTVSHQKNAQLSDDVVDTRPGLALEFWAVEEWERARRAEIEAFDKPVPALRVEMEPATADLALNTPVVHPARMQEALYSCDRAVKLARDGIAEFERHLKRVRVNVTVYQSHMDELRGEAELVAGDADYLRLVQHSTDAALKASAADHYRKAITQYQLIILQYYTPEETAARLFPKGVTKANIVQQNLSEVQIADLFALVRASFPANLAQMDDGEFIAEFFDYIQRAQVRLTHLK